MTSRSDLLSAISTLLGPGAPVYTAAKANDAYEVYALSLVLTAAEAEGASIAFESASGAYAQGRLRFRTSPGSIFSKVEDYTHVNVEFEDGQLYEAHVGVYVEGVAGVVHECDVMVMDKSEAQFCRANAIHPKRRDVVLSAECKFYSTALGIRVAREFIGMTADLGTPGRFLISNSDAASVDRLLTHHQKRRALKVSPINIDIENQAVAQFRRVFHDLKSRRR